MFRNNRKTIGVFINRAELEYQHNLCSFLIRNAEELGYNLAIMCSYEIRQSGDAYDIYGNLLVDFAPIEEFAACIVTLDCYDEPAVRERLIRNLVQRSKGPVISFREKSDVFYNVLSNANESTYHLVRYLHEDKGLDRIFFLGGYEGHIDATARLEYYYQAMKELCLPIYVNSVYYGDMWRNRGDEAFQYFFSDPEHLPQAVVCANDYMAIAFCQTCSRKGIRIPEDIMVTGVDDISESSLSEPSLTTVAPDFEKMAKETMHLIDDLLHGVDREKTVVVSVQTRYRTSTADLTHVNRTEAYLDYYSRLRLLIEENTLQNYYRIDLNGCMDIRKIRNIVYKNLKLTGNYKDFCLCMMAKRDEDNIPIFGHELLDTSEILLLVKDRKQIQDPGSIPTKELLPEALIEDRPLFYYFMLLHDRENTYGYTAISFKKPEDGMDIFYHEWSLTIGLTLREYSNHYLLHNLAIARERASKTDFLTGLNNRRALEEYVASHWPEWLQRGREVVIFSVDLDRLKYINDTYGHREGDYAIQTVADALSTVAPPYAVVARTGGDEFMIVMEQRETKAPSVINHLRQELLKREKQTPKPYRITVSVGYYDHDVRNSITYDTFVTQSDAALYIDKNRRKENGYV
ncbi:MAG: GGDEF domain-containing protein [Blautia sp.]|nr:GGDEF domain-containing protein [Blautia sp.]